MIMIPIVGLLVFSTSGRGVGLPPRAVSGAELRAQVESTMVHQYLQRRLEITHRAPVLRVCRPELQPVVTAALQADLVRSRIVKSVDFGCLGSPPYAIDGGSYPGLTLSGTAMEGDTLRLSASFSERSCLSSGETALFARQPDVRLLTITFGVPTGSRDCIGKPTRTDSVSGARLAPRRRSTGR